MTGSLALAADTSGPVPVACCGFDGCVKVADTPHTPVLTGPLPLPVRRRRVAHIQRHNAGAYTAWHGFC